MRSLAGRTAFVTGGTSGIGLGIACALVGAGMKVILGYRSNERRDEALEALAAHPGAEVRAIAVDVTDRAAVAEAAAEATRAFGKIHVLCNNAGVNQLGPMDEAGHDDWDWIMDVNFNGVVNCLVSFIPRIKAHGEGGHILNVGSMSSFIPGVQAGIYAASKFALRGLSESLRLSLARYGIGVSLLCPGLTKSNIWQAPLRRPDRFAQTAFKVDPQRLDALARIHAFGMDPMDVGRKALDGILRDAPYIFSHAEFKDELGEIHDEIVRAFPDDAIDPQRLAFESARRRSMREARAPANGIDADRTSPVSK